MTTNAAIQILTDDERFQKFCDSVLVEVSRLKESSEEGESFSSCAASLRSCLARAGEVAEHLSDDGIMSMNQVVRRKDATGFDAALNKMREIRAKGLEPCPMVGSKGRHSWNINGNECSCGAIYDYEQQRQLEERLRDTTVLSNEPPA